MGQARTASKKTKYCTIESKGEKYKTIVESIDSYRVEISETSKVEKQGNEILKILQKDKMSAQRQVIQKEMRILE